jgi:hypothetical protein
MYWMPLTMNGTIHLHLTRKGLPCSLLAFCLALK